MTFGESIKTVYSKYFVFSGRASRSEFWWYQLFYLVVVGFPVSYISPILDNVWTLANFIPSIAVACRRLHDTDRSGWWQVLPAVCLPLVLIPIFDWDSGVMFWESTLFWIGAGIGAALYILLIVWFATPGTQGDNRFGPDPSGTFDAEIFD